MTLKMSEQIIEAAQFNYKLRVRLAGVCDLIAAEAKYHLPCLSAFKRNAEKAKLETKERHTCMVVVLDQGSFVLILHLTSLAAVGANCLESGTTIMHVCKTGVIADLASRRSNKSWPYKLLHFVRV